MITMFVKIVERDKIQEDTWETKTQIRIDYPEFFFRMVLESQLRI